MAENKVYDVIVVGELNVDLIFNGLAGKLPRIGTEIIADEMTLTLGSSSAIFASNLSVLGPRIAFIGKVGRDNFASLIMKSLRGKGVDTSLILESASHNTGITVACSYGEERAMVTYPGAMEHLVLSDISAEQLSAGRHFHLSNVFLQKGLKPDLTGLYRMAKQLGLTTSFDPQWDPDENWDIDLQELLPHVDLFMPNAEEIKHLTATENLSEAIRSISGAAHVVVVKDGIRGAHLWTKDVQMHLPVFKNNQVADTIGAGDSFNAGFISGFIRNKPLEECLKLGVLAGAINTTMPGGTTAFSDLEEVKQIARERFNSDLT